jgi:hypothetical protein
MQGGRWIEKEEQYQVLCVTGAGEKDEHGCLCASIVNTFQVDSWRKFELKQKELFFSKINHQC